MTSSSILPKVLLNTCSVCVGPLPGSSVRTPSFCRYSLISVAFSSLTFILTVFLLPAASVAVTDIDHRPSEPFYREPIARIGHDVVLTGEEFG